MCENVYKQYYDNIDCIEVNDLVEFIDEGYTVNIVNDHQISMINGGDTSFFKKKEEYFNYSSGQNWRDQEENLMSIERLKKALQKAIDNVLEDFEKFEYDTQDANVSYLQIIYK